MSYDFVVVGSGLFGAVFAHEATAAGRRCLVVERRPHVGGNCFTEEIDGVHVHRYGAHIFHTNDRRVWDFVNRFADFRQFCYRPRVRSRGQVLSFPINLLTLHQLWGVCSPAEARRRLEASRVPIEHPQNFEEACLAAIGEELYLRFIHGYTHKQWGRPPRELPASIFRRLPVRLTYDDNYFSDDWQGMPRGGYTQIFHRLLEGSELRLGVDFFDDRPRLERLGRVVYTGPVDRFFDYRFGHLEYRSLTFVDRQVDGDFQGTAVVNHPDLEEPQTRTIEHRHFEGHEAAGGLVTWETPCAFDGSNERYYPVPDARNRERYQQYSALNTNAILGGRLGRYQYYDMHQVIAAARVAAATALK